MKHLFLAKAQSPQRWVRLIFFVAFASFAPLRGIIPSQSPRSNYAKSIDPIFQEKCAACHNHATRQGGLNLESHESLMSGGKSGAVIVPGKSAESRLVKMIEGTIKPRMPIGDELSAAEISAIKAWIDAGAAGPNATLSEAAPVKPSESKLNIPDIKPTAAVNAAISSLAYNADGSMLALGRYQQIELLNSSNRSSIAKLSGHANQIRALAFSPDGKMLAAAGGNPGQFGEIKLWDVAERKELRTIHGHRDNIFAIAFGPASSLNGQLLATCSYDRMVKLWDAATGREVRDLKDHTDAVFHIAFSPDGKRLASASADRTVKIWDVATGQRLYTMSDALDAVNAVAFHPSGKMLAGAGADRIIRIWELAETEGKQIKSLISHEDAITQLAYSPDGRLLASTGADRLLKIWDSAELREIHTAELQPDWVFALAFSPDGKRLAVGRHDGSFAFYDPMTGKNLTNK